MRIAILSLSKTDPKDVAMPVGLSRVGNSTLLMYHIKLAKKAGVEKILCHVDSVAGELATHEAYARSLGIDWFTIRGASGLRDYVSSDDHIIVIADGLFIDETLFDTFISADNEACILTADADNFDGSERLDINSAWAGLLSIPGSMALVNDDIPDDWSMESVLLRRALANDITDQRVSGAQIANGEIATMPDVDLDLATRLPDSPTGSSWMNFSEFLADKIAKTVSRKFWKLRNGNLLLNSGISFLAFAALLAISLGWLLLTPIFLFLCWLGFLVAQKLDWPIIRRKEDDYLPLIFGLLAWVAVSIVLWTNSQTLFFGSESGIRTAVASMFMVSLWLVVNFISILLRGHSALISILCDPLTLSIFSVVALILDAFGEFLAIFIFLQLCAVAWCLGRKDNTPLTKP